MTLIHRDRIPTAIDLPMDKIIDFCHRWQICEFALFGSVLRDDFRPDSDIDILVDFCPEAKRGLREALQMHDELETLFNRKVDLIPKTAIARSQNLLIPFLFKIAINRSLGGKGLKPLVKAHYHREIVSDAKIYSNQPKPFMPHHPELNLYVKFS